MERGFSHSFADVRIWPEPGPWDSPESVGADAYAIGRDVVFAPDAYQPDSVDGQRLLAHELAHVVQQSDAVVDDGVSPASRTPNPAAEADAYAAALAVVGGGSAEVEVSTAPTVAPGIFDFVKQIGGAAQGVAGGLATGGGGLMDLFRRGSKAAGGVPSPLLPTGPIVQDDNLGVPGGDAAMLEMQGAAQQQKMMFQMLTNMQQQQNEQANSVVRNLRG